MLSSSLPPLPFSDLFLLQIKPKLHGLCCTLPDVALPTQMTFSGHMWHCLVSQTYIRFSHVFMHGVPTEWDTLLPFSKHTLI